MNSPQACGAVVAAGVVAILGSSLDILACSLGLLAMGTPVMLLLLAISLFGVSRESAFLGSRIGRAFPQ